MIPILKSKAVQFPKPAQPLETDGLSGEGIFSDSQCKQAASEKNSHALSQSKGDLLKDTSDSSLSSYYTALCSEADESFKDCLESFEDEGAAPLNNPPDGESAHETDQHHKTKTAPGSLSEQSLAGMKRFWSSPAEDTAEQLQGTPRGFDTATCELLDQSRNDGHSCAATSLAIVHSVLNGRQISRGDLPAAAERPLSQHAGWERAASNEVCRYRGYLSAKEKQQVPMSIPAKNSSTPGDSNRRGLSTRELQPGDRGSKYLDHPSRVNALKPREPLLKSRKTKGGQAPVVSQAACPQYCAEHSSAGSDSEEADNEVQKLTALSFQSLSCTNGGSLDMYSSSNETLSSLSNSLSEESNGVNRWSAHHELRKAEVLSQAKGSTQFLAARQVPEKELPSRSFGQEQFECVDVVLESTDSRRGHSKKRTVPKRQIQLKQRDRKEMNFFAAGDCRAHQPVAASGHDPSPKGRTISDEFRINYKQFVKTASLDDSCSKTKMASCLVKNVLAKKMQYEQRIRMEQKSMQGSSTSSLPSPVSTDPLGDFMEGKSSSLSKSDGSCSVEELQSVSTNGRSDSIAISQESIEAMRPAKGVVLNEQQRENVCKLKKTFNELNERMKHQEAGQFKPLPILADGVNGDSRDSRKQVARERTEYQSARALFESKQADGKGLGVAPIFSKAQKPWPSLKQRAIRQNEHTLWKEEKVPFKPKSLMGPRDPSRNIFTSTTQEMKLIPQSKLEQRKMLSVSRHLAAAGGSEEKRLAPVQHSSLILPTSCRLQRDGKTSRSDTAGPQESRKTESNGKGRIHQPRDVRKLVKNTYSLCFKSSHHFNTDQETNTEDILSPSIKESPATSPLFIHCSSVCRKKDEQMGTQSHGKNWEQQLNLDMSAHSNPDQRVSDPQQSVTLNPITDPPVEGPVSLTKSKCNAKGESPMHITQIESKKKAVVENAEPQLKPENKPMTYERSELNVTPPSNASRKTRKIESQLNIKVNTSLSKHTHKTQADYIPAPSYSALDGRSTNDSSTQAKYNALEKNAIVLSPSSASPEDIKKHHDTDCITAMPDHLLEAYMNKEPDLPFQDHVSTEIISLTPRDRNDFLVSPKGEKTIAEPGPTKEGCRHLQPIKPTVTSTPLSHTNALPNKHFVNSSSQKKAMDKIFAAPQPLDSQVFMPASSVSPKCANSSGPLRAKEYNEGPRSPGALSVPLSSPSGKLLEQRDSWDHWTKQQVANEQYFTATHAENANYLTMPGKSQKAEADSNPSTPSHPDHTLDGSCVFFQPGREAPGNAKSSEPSLPQAASQTVHDLPSHRQPLPRVNDSPSFRRRSSGASPCSKSALSPTRSFAPHSQAHRKMLVDPDSGKCYYMETPRQHQMKMLYDPETGQYIEVLIPPVPMASHNRLYPSPFNPLVMNPGVYGPSYMHYPGFPGFSPPPVAMPSDHPDLPNLQPDQENANINETFSHSPKSEAPPAIQATDSNYLESLYYIPTGMNASPSPNQPLFSPATSVSTSMPEKGSLFRM